MKTLPTCKSQIQEKLTRGRRRVSGTISRGDLLKGQATIFLPPSQKPDEADTSPNVLFKLSIAHLGPRAIINLVKTHLIEQLYRPSTCCQTTIVAARL